MVLEAFKGARATVLLLAALLEATACVEGGQTGQDTSGPNQCALTTTTEQDAVALLEAYAGTYRAPAVRSASDDRCPAETYTTLEVTISAAVSEEELGNKPCGARYIPVSVEVATDDAEPSTGFQGWLSEYGEVVGDGYSLVLSRSSNEVNSLEGFEPLRTIEPCCLTPPPEGLTSGVELGSTGALTLQFTEPDSDVSRSTELSLSLTLSEAATSCGAVRTNFELRAAGELAASGGGWLDFSSTSCAGAEPPCLAVDYYGFGDVVDQARLMGYADYPGELVIASATFEGIARGGALETRKLVIEVNSMPVGGVVLTEAP